MSGDRPPARGPCPRRSSPRSANAPRAARAAHEWPVLAGNLRVVPCPPFARAPFARDVAAESGFSYHQQSGASLLSGRIQPVDDVAGAKRRAKQALGWPSRLFSPIRATRLRKPMVGEPRFRGSISPHRPTPICSDPSWPLHRPASALGGLPAQARGALDAHAKGKRPMVLFPRALAELYGRPHAPLDLNTALLLWAVAWGRRRSL